MKKVKLNRDVSIMGLGVLKAGATYKVIRHNKRYVYIEIREGLECRLSRKDCDIMY